MGTTYSYISSYWYATPNNIDITIKNLEQQHRKLTQKILELEKKNDALIQLAIREFKKNKINKAISLMKIKTLYEQEINKIENLLFCISTQELALNSSCTLQDSLHTIKHASSTMNALNTNIDLSNVTGVNSTFEGARFYDAPDLSTATFPSTDVEFSKTFKAMRTENSNTHVDFSNVSVKISFNIGWI